MTHGMVFEPGEDPPCPGAPRLRVVFAGMDGRFSTAPLQALARRHHLVGVVHSLPRPVRRGWLVDWARAGSGGGNLRRFAEHLGCPFFSAGRSADPSLAAFLHRARPDLLCLSNFSFLLPPEVLEIPRRGAINLHLSLLPRHRGPNPWLWMFHDQDRTGGVSVHLVDEGEDSGPLLGTLEHEVPEGITAGELADAVLPRAAALLVDVVDALAGGNLVPVPQACPDGMRRARFVSPGEALIDWPTWPASRVSHFLRGASLWYEPFPPIPGFVRRYGPALPGKPEDPPGTLRQAMRTGWISCCDGRVPFRLQAVPRELWRLGLPLAVGAGLWALA